MTLHYVLERDDPVVHRSAQADGALQRKVVTMRAVGVMVHGGPDALEVVDLPKSTPAPARCACGLRSGGEPTDDGTEWLTGRAAEG
jgi:hypothetical protein